MSSFKTIQFKRKKSDSKPFEFCNDNSDFNNSYHKNTKSFLKKEPLAIFFIFLFILGIILGAVLSQFLNDKLLNDLNFIFLNNFQFKSDCSFIQIFVDSLFISSLFVFICFILGMSMIGIFVLPLMCLFKGLGLGLVSGYLISLYSVQGFFFNLLIIVPGAFLSSLAFLVCAKYAQIFSFGIFSKGIPLKKTPKQLYTFKEYCKKCYKCFFIIGISSLIDASLNCFFARFFNF
ncbi:MAG: hypothetical protein Q4B14_04995 [Clostridia bacterium]|nr:hypothetical protein [Clostridia bacterium]